MITMVVKWECVPLTRSKPHVCPVCSGRGTVPAGFYREGPDASKLPQTCRTCWGSGVVWEPVNHAAKRCGDAGGTHGP